MNRKILLLIISVFGVNSMMAQTAEKIDMYPQLGMTFYWGSSSPTIQNEFAKDLKKVIRADFPNDTVINVKSPSSIGYQFHVRHNLSIGVVYSSSQVSTHELKYPDFQNPGKFTTFQYVFNTNSLMATVDYYWYKKKFPKATLALHSGLALGTFNYSFTTKIISGNGSNLPQYNVGMGSNAFQLTLIGIKHNMKVLKGLGWFSNLGVGNNTIGFSGGLNFCL